MRPNKYATIRFRDKSVDPFDEYDNIVDTVMFYNDYKSERDDLTLVCELMSIDKSSVSSYQVEDLASVSIVSEVKKYPGAKGANYLWSCGYQGLNPSNNIRTIWITGGHSRSYKEAAERCEEEIKKIEYNEVQCIYFHV